MIKGTTKTGFQFSISDEARDDMEILENLSKFGEGRIDLVPKTLVALLGEKQKDKLYEHCTIKGKSGKSRVSAKKIMQELQNIFEEAGKASEEIKN